MAKAKVKDDDIFSAVERELNEQDENEGGEPAVENEKPKQRSVKIGEQEVPYDQVPAFVAKQVEDLNKSKEELLKMRKDLSRAISGEQPNQEDSFDEVEFLSNKEYRQKYLDNLVTASVSKKQKELEDKIERQSQQHGEAQYNSLKRDIQQELEEQDIPFDFSKNEKKIEAIVLERFNPEYIRKYPKKALMYAVNKLVGGKMSSNDDDLGIESPSNLPSGGRKKTVEDEIKKRIADARPDGAEDAGQSVFG